MRYVVFKSLDKSSSLFGIQGTYLYWVLGALGVDLALSFIVGSATNSFVGFIMFVAIGAGIYFATLMVQTRLSERERTKWICSHRLPRFVYVPPRMMRRYNIVEFSDVRRPSKEKGDTSAS